MIFLKSRNLQHRNLLRDKLRAKMVIRATALFNLQRNNVARQVVRKCCPYYLTLRKQQHCLQIFKKHFQMNYLVGVRDGLMICIWRVNHVPDPVLPGPAMPIVNQERLVLNF